MKGLVWFHKRIATRYASGDNLALMKCNTSLTQHSIRYPGCKIWNDLPDKFKKTFYLCDSSFRYHIKHFLIEAQT